MSTKRTPPRVAARPDPRDWGEDELLTLPETAALFWPDGPLTTHSLRVAVRDGVLAVAVVAGRYMTTRRAVSEMSKCARLSEHGGSSN
jgi:hypothetical protein